MADITPVKTKAKRVLSDEQKAKMLEGRKKAAEIKKAQKAILKNEKIKEKENEKKHKVKNKELSSVSLISAFTALTTTERSYRSIKY